MSERESEASCETVPAAAKAFENEQGGEQGHCFITLLCTLNSEEDRRRYLSLTREIALPLKAAHPACLRVTQTIPRNSDKMQVLWIQEWLSSTAFTNFMQDLFREEPRMQEVSDCLTCKPTLTISSLVGIGDLD
jgi:hypothetical protein